MWIHRNNIEWIKINPSGPGPIPIQSLGASPLGIGLELNLSPWDFLIHSILFQWIPPIQGGYFAEGLFFCTELDSPNGMLKRFGLIKRYDYRVDGV